MKFPSDLSLSSREFASIAGIEERRATRALSRAVQGYTWRGHPLSVIAQYGRGGSSGLSYLVRIDSLPADLRLRAEAMFGQDEAEEEATASNLPVPVQNHLPVSLSAAPVIASREWEWRLEVIRPALQHGKDTPERSAAIQELSNRVFMVPHKAKGHVRKSFSENTLRSWLNKYEGRGIAGLCRKSRSDKGENRVIISRSWDDAVPFTDDQKYAIQQALITRVKTIWTAAGGGKGVGGGKNGGGWRICARLASHRLIELTREAGCGFSDAQLVALCEVPRGFVEPHRNFAILALKNNDAKGFFDKALPRTRRTRYGMLPMDLVVGDVHHLDIYLSREDGSLFTPKIIAWCDLATNRMFCTLAFVEKGKGIRQGDVIASFIDMTQHPEWGMPKCLYLDNGGEYSKLGFVDDAMKLAQLAGCQDFRLGHVDDDPGMRNTVTRAANSRRKMVVNAQPYNAPAKPIEGVFAVLEAGPLAMLPGWIGGDRMKAKTKNVGKAPSPFDGDEEAFSEAFHAALDYYHTNPQDGSLKGLTPWQAFTQAVENGWRRIDVERFALQTVFASEEIREVSQGEFSYNGTFYRAERLLSLLPGTKVVLRIPHVGDRNRLPIMDLDGNFLCIAEPSTLHGFLDQAGAAERSQRTRQQNRALAVMAEEVEDIDLPEEMRKAAQLHPPAPIPDSAGTIRLSDQAEEIAKATKQLPASRTQAEDDQYRERLARSAALTKLAEAS